MIDSVLDARPRAADPAAAGRTLAERLGAGPEGLPAAGAAPEWAAALADRLPPAATCAVLEHLFGVLPLLDGWLEPGLLAEAAAGRALGALGLFTPTPELGWEAAAVAGEAAGEGLLLRGAVRLPTPMADAAVVLVRLAGDGTEAGYRLAWVAAGEAARHGSRSGGPPRPDGPCWLLLDGLAVGPGRVSPPVSPAPGSPLWRRLDLYAAVWALAAAREARRGVGALRRAARTTLHAGRAFAASQLVALDITGAEIEAELAEAAVRGAWELAPGDPGRPAGLALAAAAGRALSAVAARARDLADGEGLGAGLEIAPGLAAELARPLAFLGGPLMVEHELGRALGIPDGPAAPGGPAAPAAERAP